MKRNANKNSHWFIWLCIGLGIGVTIGKLFDWGYFELSREVSVVDALNIFITIGLTLYIASVLEKRIKHKQFKSDLYVAKINEIEDHLHRVEMLVQDRKLQYQQISTISHIIGIAKNSLIKSILEIDDKKFDTINHTLKSKHQELKSLLTDRPIDRKDKSVTVQNNLVTYSPERIEEIVTVIYAIK